MKRAPIVLVLTGACLAQPAAAQDDAEAPELDFLEYLGSWQEEDDEWVEIAEWEKDNPEKDDPGKDRDEDGEDTPPPEPQKEDR